MKFPESAFAHKLLDGLQGVEIGGSSHNPFGLKTINVDIYPSMDTVYKKEEIKLCGEAMKVDVVAPGDALPFPDNSEDFIISSHVLEHFFDPIKALKEWYRVVKPGGYIYSIIPHKERTFDKDKPRTTLQELIDRHEGRIVRKESEPPDNHWSIWITQDVVELITWLGWNITHVQDVDEKVGNGFTLVVQKS